MATLSLQLLPTVGLIVGACVMGSSYVLYAATMKSDIKLVALSDSPTASSISDDKTLNKKMP